MVTSASDAPLRFSVHGPGVKSPAGRSKQDLQFALNKAARRSLVFGWA